MSLYPYKTLFRRRAPQLNHWYVRIYKDGAKRHCREKVDESSSEADDVVFSDVNGAQETDLTSDDNDDNDNDNDNNDNNVNHAQDHSDLADFLANNEHPPEYYIDQLKNFDETIYNQEDYSSET
ncbi:hypothetical protein TSTA_074000 [Talaromyces stipitatus ATCC 10500]|uniref:Uncharacterized protein n=1 Tax=Talaromyces stipitatus (strain ATCC 10500 / CBS 375.48 / QM 6759 / NRRL 1006) TaxID=441959 RepID=B8LVJ6_TALSN|nr:uncharacterized protein TSTA_074000 [Talaromyces stipitatus ATCC 10500]EED24015.1 hypothetical protein TSTA_074000 [Talaromyces stipitatus ATCC 10500]